MSVAAVLLDHERRTTLIRQREAVQRRLSGASQGGPEWDAAMDHLDEIDAELANAAPPTVAEQRRPD